MSSRSAVLALTVLSLSAIGTGFFCNMPQLFGDGMLTAGIAVVAAILRDHR